MSLAWREWQLQAVVVAAVAAVLLAAGCVDEEPTSPGSPATVVRGYNDCWPEVISESTDSTETHLVTFTVTLAPDDYVCYPNLVQYGIDMADPVGVDTPQGNGFARIETALPIFNMPSPPYAALGAGYTPAQFMIEFDPPVRSVEFYYSRRGGSRAWWTVDGRWSEVVTESTLVQATSRIPGTLQYTLYDTEVLHTNSSSTAWDGWTPVKFTAPGDKIQWLHVYGTLAFDDFKITRKPLACTSIQRGQQVRCEVILATGWNVTLWEFQPDDPNLPLVQDTSTGKVWQGVAATKGTVTVRVTDGATVRSYTARMNVTNRSSKWKSLWSYRSIIDSTLDAEPGGGVTLGHNCPEVLGCIQTLRVQPDPIQFRGQGYTGAQITSGPNKGYWYVADAIYDMTRYGGVNPAILPSSGRIHPLPANVPKRCRRTLGFGPKDAVCANFHQYNDKCQNISMTTFVDAVYGHEGLGYNGGQGHESLARVVASNASHDPHRRIETLVFPDSATLEVVLHSTVVPIAVDITDRSDDQSSTQPGYPVPNGNYPGGPMWYWDVNSSVYFQGVMQAF